MRAPFTRLVFAWMVAVAPLCATAQDYPARPVRFIVGFVPGGIADLLARALAQKLTDAWGQQVIVDNRAGGGGVISMQIVGKAAPDGYTLLMGSSTQFSINPALRPNLPYDPVRDYTPVSNAAITPVILTVQSAYAARSLQDLIQLAKKGEVKSYGSTGYGGAPHIAAGKVRGPLHGIPVVLKDNYDTADMPTTGGSVLLEGNMAPDDANMVKRLRDADRKIGDDADSHASIPRGALDGVEPGPRPLLDEMFEASRLTWHHIILCAARDRLLKSGQHGQAGDVPVVVAVQRAEGVREPVHLGEREAAAVPGPDDHTAAGGPEVDGGTVEGFHADAGIVVNRARE